MESRTTHWSGLETWKT